MVTIFTVLFTIAPELANRTDAGFIRLTRSRPKLAGNWPEDLWFDLFLR